MKRKMTLAQISRYELEQAIVHEVGHLVVAEHYDCCAEIMVWRNVGAPETERTWLGRCSFYERLPKSKIKFIALAGEIATCLWRGEDEDDVLGLFMDPWQRADLEMSDTDLALAGRFTEKHVQTAVQVLQSLWPKVVAMTEGLVATVEANPKGEGPFWMESSLALKRALPTERATSSV